MGILAWVLGILGGLCAVMGIITATDVLPEAAVVPEVAGLTWVFWLALAVVLLVGSVAAIVGRGSGAE